MTEKEKLNRVEQCYRSLLARGRKIDKLFAGNPNECGFHFPPQIIARAYADYFSSPKYRPDPKGLRAAREAIARYYGDHSAVVDPSNIMLTSGTSESFFWLFSLLTQPGDEILTPCPSYPLFYHIAKLAHVRLVPYRLVEEKKWAIDLVDLRKKTTPRTRAIVLISPHNPTGMVASREELLTLTEWANAKGLALISDEVFSEFYFGDGDFPRLIFVAKPDLCFTLNGISKMFALPALKLGWIAVSGEKKRVEQVIDELETTADTFLSVHTPIQKALPLLFAEGREFVSNYVREVGNRRNLCLDILSSSPDIKIISPAGGFYLTAKVTKPLPISDPKGVPLGEEAFVIRLLDEESIFVHPGYFYDSEEGIHFVISFLHPEEMLRSSLQKIRTFISRL